MTTSSGLVNNSDFVIAIEVGADVIVRPAVYLSSRTHTGTHVLGRDFSVAFLLSPIHSKLVVYGHSALDSPSRWHSLLRQT